MSATRLKHNLSIYQCTALFTRSCPYALFLFNVGHRCRTVTAFPFLSFTLSLAWQVCRYVIAGHYRDPRIPNPKRQRPDPSRLEKPYQYYPFFMVNLWLAHIFGTNPVMLLPKLKIFLFQILRISTVPTFFGKCYLWNLITHQ